MSEAYSVWAIFAQAAAIGVGAALSPGPFQSLVIAQALLGGWRRAAPVTFAPLLADIPVAVAMVFVMRQVPPAFLRSIQLAGAALLAYLAWDLWRQLRSAAEAAATEADQNAPPAWRSLLQGMLMLFLSPGTYLFWGLVLGPLLLRGLAHSSIHGVAMLAGFYIFSIGGLLGIAFVLGKLGQFNPKMRRVLQTASLVLMLGMAFWLLYDGMRV
ncbi:MAG: LysE family transporter [Anaerolineales bacterium]|nr:LysE family transporter [Anaerolineales bacterium]